MGVRARVRARVKLRVRVKLKVNVRVRVRVRVKVKAHLEGLVVSARHLSFDGLIDCVKLHSDLVCVDQPERAQLYDKVSDALFGRWHRVLVLLHRGVGGVVRHLFALHQQLVLKQLALHH